ncbi:Ger(x)C family spore germination protein [Paenibacillus chartarius]|uniref:Ger(X)C family spore germination protein n=1 Tax=Paenibacillus chartarius TaxID=747481 RepID=A0ABV6DV02_9BACL
MHPVYRAALALILCVVLPGCWNRTELNEIGIASASGFDRSGEDWVGSFQIIVPSAMASGTTGGGGGGGGNSPAINVHSVKGQTIMEAASLSNLENPRRLYFAHNNVVIIGKEAAEKGVGQLIDLYLRNAESRETVLLLLTEQKASEMLRKLLPPEKIAGAGIAEILRKEKDLTSMFAPVTVFDVANKMINTDTKAIGVPVIAVSGGTDHDNETDLESMDAFKKTSPTQKIKLVKLGIFHNNRLVGWMDRKESRGLNWMTDKVNGTLLAISSSASNRKPNISLTIVSSKTTVHPVKQGEKYVMNVNVKAKGDLNESGGKLMLTDRNVLLELEEQAEREIESEIKAGWKAMRRLGVDAAGFTDSIHRRMPADWKQMKGDWKAVFDKMELNVRVQVTIKRQGLIQNSY